MTETQVFKNLFGIEEPPVIPLTLKDIPDKAMEMAGRMSISGVQPKLIVELDKKNKLLNPIASGGLYILKPQTDRFPYVPENENCCMDIAADLGIEVPPHCLLPLKDGNLAYVVKRFDRQGKEKIHQEDFFQILEKRDKYAGSLEEIGRKLGEISSAPGLDVQLFFERILFNFLIGNGDGHHRNYSVSYLDKDTLRLSPAYDIVCSKLVIKNEEDSALTLNGKKNKLQRKDFDVFADYFKIPEKVRYEKFTGNFAIIRNHIEKSKLPRDLQNRFVEIVTERYLRLGI